MRLSLISNLFSVFWGFFLDPSKKRLPLVSVEGAHKALELGRDSD